MIEGRHFMTLSKLLAHFYLKITVSIFYINIIYIYIFGENYIYSNETSYSNWKMTHFEVKSVKNQNIHFFEGYSQCY